MTNKPGRNPKYQTYDAMSKSVDKYFAACDKDKRPPTVTGLAYHLGFKSRNSFYDYQGRPKFMDLIESAKLRIEIYHEEKLAKGNAGGSVFYLKNAGWVDKTEVTYKDANLSDYFSGKKAVTTGKKTLNKPDTKKIIDVKAVQNES